MTVRPRIVTLVVDDPRGVLPTFEVESPWWMESGPVVEAARSALGLEVTVLRLLDGEAFPGGPVTYLVECDKVDPARLEPWIGELVDDSHRASYARPGGVSELAEWADAELARIGLRRSGPVEQVRTWNLSCLLRIRTTDSHVFWLKAVPEFFGHESDVMRALASVDASLVPDLVATRPGATLMKEVGDTDGYEVGPDRHFDAVRRFDVARRRLDLDDLVTVPRFAPGDMVDALAAISQRHGDELSPQERRKLAALIDQVDDRWTAADVRETLVHGDLHGGNLRLAADAPHADGNHFDTIIDWGDASISHPLFDLAVLGNYTPEWGAEATDRWLDLIGCDRSGWSAFRPLAAVRLAIVYQGFCDRIESSEQIYHRHDIVPALRTGLSAFDE